MSVGRNRQTAATRKAALKKAAADMRAHIENGCACKNHALTTLLVAAEERA